MGTRVHLDRQAYWATSVVCQVFNTKCHTILYDGGYTLSGPGTETALVERVVMSVKIPINGCNVSFPRHSRAQVDAANAVVATVRLNEALNPRKARQIWV
ncbi:MAG: hypothetical protein Q8O40_10515 [Chloroflexota bacterium]|nr:hypothetical protein [Chloroflexota bacterium]